MTTALLLERPDNLAFAKTIAHADFIPNPVEAIFAAQRALVGSEVDLSDSFTPGLVERTLDVLKGLGDAVIQPPTTPAMSVTKRMLLGLTSAQVANESLRMIGHGNTALPENFDALDPDARNAAMRASSANRRMAKSIEGAAKHADDPGVEPVMLTEEIAEVALQGIRLALDEAQQEHRQPEQRVLAGTARWIIEHTADYSEAAA